ncbi:MAG: hypothetical protein KBT39_08660 [Bacteroidales bacterium]|nr:hypothetical protein [Bacteroidales bacterium]
MKKIVLMALGMIFMSTANAQDKVEANIAVDVVSKYVWRGAECASGSVQPTLGVSYKGLSLTAWGNYGIVNSDDTQELDLTLAYSTGNFNIGITDYWFSGGDNRYFLYAAHETSHIFEANIGYDFGPVSLNWFTNFAGNDGLNKSGKRAYSSYFEVAAPFTLGGIDWNAAVGVVPYATAYYPDATGFAVTNVSLKGTYAIKITDSFSLPLFAAVTANPSSQKCFFHAGFTLKIK